MKIFILEDDKHRIAKFKRELIGHSVHHVATVKDGVCLINSNKYDIIFLDHDLGGKEFVDSFTETTGYTLAKSIALSTYNKNTPCIVHSCNPVGAQNIVNILSHAMRIPFVSLNIGRIAERIEDLNNLLY